MSSVRRLHIISFDIPYPPNYGGVVDVYFKLVELHRLGVEVILHCFYKEPKSIHHLKALCYQVHTYPRNRWKILSRLPTIVSSRMSSTLIDVLQKDQAPILIEGIHCSGFLGEMDWGTRKIGLRTHNIEHHYYAGLANNSSWLLKKAYFLMESRRLKRYESQLKDKLDFVFCLSQKDTKHFEVAFPKAQVVYCAAFFEALGQVIESKDYVLLQGNFEVNENRQAARYLLDEIIPKLPNQLFVIAGKSAEIFRGSNPKNVRIRSNPTTEEMTTLNSEAKINVVYSHLNAGVKLKILNSLASGVPVACNQELELDALLGEQVLVYQNTQTLIGLIQQNKRSLNQKMEIKNYFISIFDPRIFARELTDLLLG